MFIRHDKWTLISVKVADERSRVEHLRTVVPLIAQQNKKTATVGRDSRSCVFETRAQVQIRQTRTYDHARIHSTETTNGWRWRCSSNAETRRGQSGNREGGEDGFPRCSISRRFRAIPYAFEIYPVSLLCSSPRTIVLQPQNRTHAILTRDFVAILRPASWPMRFASPNRRWTALRRRSNKLETVIVLNDW